MFATANNTVRTYIFPLFIVDINVKVLFILWLIIQCLLMAYYPQSEVAFISHITGFVVGAGMGFSHGGRNIIYQTKGVNRQLPRNQFRGFRRLNFYEIAL